MNMSKAIVTGAVASAVLLVGSFAAWAEDGSPVQYRLISPPATELAGRVPRCGGESPAAPSAPEAPLPNAYMTVNGRVSLLTDFFACMRQLHSARLSPERAGGLTRSLPNSEIK
jgi:hypothetical protein